jgi:hypothetical protein
LNPGLGQYIRKKESVALRADVQIRDGYFLVYDNPFD